MSASDDGHAPLPQCFGEFRNGGAELPLAVLAADAHMNDLYLLLFQPLHLFQKAGILEERGVYASIVVLTGSRHPAAVAVHKGNQVQILLPVVGKRPLPLEKGSQAARAGADMLGSAAGKNCDSLHSASS